MTVCEQCAESSDAALVHGTEAMELCPQAAVVCEECSFTAGSWAGKRQGVTTGECVVAAPCSALIALADHYGIPVMAGRASVIADNARLTDRGSQTNRQRQSGRRPAGGAHASGVGGAAGRGATSGALEWWTPALQHRISNPVACWPKLDQTMTPPMTGHAYAALLRRTARRRWITADGGRRARKRKGRSVLKRLISRSSEMGGAGSAR